MVTVVDIKSREGKNGSFVVLELEGGLQVQQSKATGKMYASVAKCSLPCTFEEHVARQLIGTTLPGSIVRVPCEPYEYTNPNTGEVMTLNYQYTYNAAENNPQEYADTSARRLGSLEVN